MIQAVCLQHVACEGPGLIEPVFREKGVALRTLRIDAGQAVPDEPLDGLVVLGGPMSAYDDEGSFPTVRQEMRLIQRALEKKKPVIGICLGSQLLARACGAEVYKGMPGPEIGWFPIRLTAEASKDPVLQGLPSELNIFHWHGDTFDLPPGASLLAGSPRYPNQIFRVGSNAYGFQCHLEVTEKMVREWLEAYQGELTTHGGSVPPGPIGDHLAEHARALEPHARTALSRLAGLFT